MLPAKAEDEPVINANHQPASDDIAERHWQQVADQKVAPREGRVCAYIGTDLGPIVDACKTLDQDAKGACTGF